MRKHIGHAAACAALVLLAPGWFGAKAGAQSAASAQTGEVPFFEVDPTWPRFPPQWKVGDVADINADLQGNVYLLQRPRLLNKADFASAAPPVLVFDRNGNFLRAWGARAAAMNGLSVSTVSTSIPGASCGSAGTAVRPRTGNSG
jgi:hypothetical protein